MSLDPTLRQLLARLRELEALHEQQDAMIARLRGQVIEQAQTIAVLRSGLSDGDDRS